MTKKHTLGLVLSSGGMRCLAILALFEELKKKNVQLDLIVGSGGGAAMAALYAANYPLKDIPLAMKEMFDPKLLKKISYSSLMKIMGLHLKPFEEPPSLLKSNDIKRIYDEIFRDLRLENLTPKVLIHTTDVLTGEVIVLDSGPLSDCIYASNALYPFMRPLKINNRWLAAGFATAAFPLLTAVTYPIDFILGVKINAAPQLKSSNLIEFTSNFLSRTSAVGQTPNIAMAINMHEGETLLMDIDFDRQIDIWDVKHIHEILEAGKKAYAKYADEIDALLKESNSKF